MHSPLSVIIPALNEEDNLRQLLPQLHAYDNLQVIVVDGGSTDNSQAIVRQHGGMFLPSPRGRGRQMNTGVTAARYRHLLFLHADTRLPTGFPEKISRALNQGIGQGISQEKVAGGAFSLATDHPTTSLRLICIMANLRARCLQLPYGDQAIFTTRSQFDAVGGYPEIEIMEDFVFIRKLARQGRIVILPDKALTSARRWQNVGIFRTTLINQLVILGYYCGIAPARLARFYRRTKNP